jgi:hypothetical protein
MVVITVAHLLTGIIIMKASITTPAGAITPGRLRPQTTLLSIWDHRQRRIVPLSIWGRHPLTVASTAGTLKRRLSNQYEIF